MKALEAKLYGGWDGLGPCDGSLYIKPDGRFERKHYGPGGDRLTGTWTLRWDALPPSITLRCLTSDDPDDVGKTDQGRLVRLDGDHLKISYGSGRRPHRFERLEPSEESAP